MEKIIKDFLFEKVAALADEGYSVYEIAGLLNVHPSLIEKTTVKSSTFLNLESNNKKFILRINANYPNPLMTDIELRKYNVVLGFQGRIIFTGKFPTTFKAWEAKLENALKEELNERREREYREPEDNEATVTEDAEIISVNENETVHDAPAETSFDKVKTIEKQIISDYLDGISLGTIANKHQVRRSSLKEFIEDHNLPEKITPVMLRERIKTIFKNGASRAELENRFAHIGEYRVSLLLRQPLKPRAKKTFVEEDVSEKEERKNKITSENKMAVIEDFREGMRVDKIAEKMNIKLEEIIKLLLETGDYEQYFEKNIKDIKVRNEAIADYYKRGWKIDQLMIEFKLKFRVIVKILRAKGFAIKRSERQLKKTPLKADLVVKYFKKGRDIFDIAERLVMLPERVEFILRKKGLMDEES